MNTERHSATLKSALNKLLICPVVCVAAWLLIVIDAKSNAIASVVPARFIQDTIIAALVICGFGFIVLTSLLAAAFGKNRLLFVWCCFLFPIGPMAIYFYFRSRTAKLMAMQQPKGEA